MIFMVNGKKKVAKKTVKRKVAIKKVTSKKSSKGSGLGSGPMSMTLGLFGTKLSFRKKKKN